MTAQEDVDGARLIHVREIGSTNEEALALARTGERGPLWIRADAQVQGRGRLGREWASPLGNLYTSLLVHAPSEPRFMPQLAHVAAVALAAAVRGTVGATFELHLKWPNDLLFKGAKAAGILVEGTRGVDAAPSCVIGWGVNCAYHPAGLPYAATNLSAEVGRPVSPDEIFAVLRRTMKEALALWDRGAGYAAIRDRWMDDALPIGTPIIVKAPEPLQGCFAGIDAEGRLLLDGAHGRRVIGAGDIFLTTDSAGVTG